MKKVYRLKASKQQNGKAYDNNKGTILKYRSVGR